ncbi:adenosylcobinamide-phosphate synthase CbiB [Halochromatium glycolicum]|uniref:Cobalamin biosynthesis protein CobD n=1 Tax=Halochromatium glycolicum TaxID=85075 RepID=A0AAJ0XAS6_9GAMM|nr:adenosylcobinamide-phosphate synthase CbiB [Halochromatium glycolicum]MBK1706071.1 cobalamin biosynthesis protein CobD [Halochromatium glycolicum]
MALTIHLLLVLAASGLDAFFGDPHYRLHPVRLLGDWTLLWERLLFRVGLNGRIGGLLLWLIVVVGALGLWWAIHRGLSHLHPWLGFAWDALIAYSLLCTHDLIAQGRRVLVALDDLPRARQELQMLVSRDTGNLSPAGIVRATIESLSENLTDGVLTPLWALCLFGLPGLILVKTVSNLDSMVGYKTERYARFGWAGARSDDLVHWLPARLSVPIIALAAALLRLHPRLVLPTALKYRSMLPSPNSGWSEAACAGALRVRLVGPIWHDGQLVNEAYMGEPDWPAELGGGDLSRALKLILAASLIALAVGLALAPLRLLMPW